MISVHIAERTRIMEGIEVYTCSIIFPYKFYILYMNPPGKVVWTTKPNLLKNINLYLLKHGKDYFSQETEIDEEEMGKLERLIDFFSDFEANRNSGRIPENFKKLCEVLQIPK